LNQNVTLQFAFKIWWILWIQHKFNQNQKDAKPCDVIYAQFPWKICKCNLCTTFFPVVKMRILAMQENSPKQTYDDSKLVKEQYKKTTYAQQYLLSLIQ